MEMRKQAGMPFHSFPRSIMNIAGSSLSNGGDHKASAILLYRLIRCEDRLFSTPSSLKRSLNDAFSEFELLWFASFTATRPFLAKCIADSIPSGAR
jgi:hypothetical protein